MSQHAPTVLVVEDDAGVALLEQKRLQRAGYDVIVAANANEARLALAKNSVALVILDYRLPGEATGLDFYLGLKADGLDLPVILVTGFSNEAVVIKALRLGIRDFVTKSAEYLDYLPEAAERVLLQVRTENDLEDSRAQLASIINTAMDAVLTVEEDQCISLFNLAAEKMFRCNPADAMGRPIADFLPNCFKMSADGQLRIAGQSNLRFPEAVHTDLRGIRADGEEFPLEASITPVQLIDRLFFTVMLRDVTEKRKAEEKLRQQAALLDLAKDAIMVRDLDDKILYWNRGAETLYGWSSAEAVGKKPTELVYTKEGLPAREDSVRSLFANGQWDGELRQVSKQLKEIVIESHQTLLRDEAGRPRAVLIINTDITERKRLFAQFLRSQRMESVGALAAGIAHDLNNMLTPIMMAAQLLRSPLPKKDLDEVLTTVEASVHHGAALVQQILTFSRGKEGVRTHVQLRYVIGEVVRMLGHILPKNIDVRPQIPSNLMDVTGDPTQLSQVLTNLCINARDAMPGGGTLMINAANVSLSNEEVASHPQVEPGPFVRIEVEDTGTGIAPAVLDRIFEPFFTTKGIGKGTGLGLSTSLSIMQSHGGYIQVESTVNKGSKFTVFLPALTVPLEIPRVNEAAAPPGHGETILVVEDEKAILAMVSTILQKNGYRVLTALGGIRALELFQLHQPDIRLVLLDLTMPPPDGAATLRAMQSLDPGVRVLVSSGMMGGKEQAVALGLGEGDFLSKPFSPASLLTAVRKALTGAGAP